jgi:hypothetical protein
MVTRFKIAERYRVRVSACLLELYKVYLWLCEIYVMVPRARLKIGVANPRAALQDVPRSWICRSVCAVGRQAFYVNNIIVGCPTARHSARPSVALRQRSQFS